MYSSLQSIESILFISLSCVGDAVMTTPVLESLHQHFPDAKIDIVADRRSAILYRNCPYRNRILLKDKKKFLRGSVELLKELRKTRYDLIVDLRTDGLAYLCHGRSRFTKWGRKPYGAHAVEQLIGIIHSIHGETPVPAATVWLSAEEKQFARQTLADLPAGPWLEFAPAVALETKAWPVENYVQLANALTDLFTAVILDGGPAETAVTAAVAKGLQLPYVDLAGKTSLLQAAAVLERARLFVGSDSGLGHVAAAVATPTLTLFSNDTPERVLPWGKHSHWLKSADGIAASISVSEVEEKVRSIFTGLTIHQN
jgi:heptosyltransferase-3